jgi:hypothetical protein
MILINNGKIEKYVETDRFFDDIEFLSKRNIRVPAAIQFMRMVNKDKDVQSPIQFEDIEKAVRCSLRRRD